MAMIIEKRAIKLGYKEDKPTVYKMAAVRQQKVTYDKLLDEVSNSCGVNSSQSKAVIEALIDRMTMFMDYGMGVQMGEFGTFQPGIISKAKANEDEISSSDVKRLKIRFYPGKRFKNMLAQMSVTTFDDGDDDAVTEDDTASGGTTDGGTTDGGGQEFTKKNSLHQFCNVIQNGTKWSEDVLLRACPKNLGNIKVDVCVDVFFGQSPQQLVRFFTSFRMTRLMQVIVCTLLICPKHRFSQLQV